MGDAQALTAWLVRHRGAIEAELRARVGDLAPNEAEILRRFRSYLGAALLTGQPGDPSFEGLHPVARRTEKLLTAWEDAVGHCAGPDAGPVCEILAPWRARFCQSVRESAPARRRSGAPRRSSRRAVSAAIDRVADVFLAVDAETGQIADANPAAGALLGAERDALLGSSALEYFAPGERERVWAELDAIAEGSDSRRFDTQLHAREGHPIRVEARATAHRTRQRTLALVLARPTG